ncbi:hypothetical protein NFI96_002371 [Prochilodus magdalenae]|nr:hypothetical protein NFI96_002371 [Prochilodus magdalenae]
MSPWTRSGRCGLNTVTGNYTSYDPCSNYTSLDQPWRANNATGLNICDRDFSWDGWYRFFYYGMNIRMPESCVPTYRCGTYYTLWLNGPHPEIEDGVVTRQVCGNAGSDCCYFGSTSVRVKACPGNYYVYELARPAYCNVAYCTDASTITLTTVPTMDTGADSIRSTTSVSLNSTFDPCYNYTVLDDIWRAIYSSYGSGYYTSGSSGYYRSHDDSVTEWNGWYRLYLQGANAQIPEWCVTLMTSGGYTPLLLGGSHPLVSDGIVTRSVYGPYDYYSSTVCNYYRSNPIQIKACPSQYYVYKLVKPDVSIPMATYTAVVRNSYISYDPCTNYTSLDQPWRANNETGLGICDSNANWNGWYRLFYYGMNIRMPESCVNVNRCGTSYPLWLNGPHPQIEDGVVTRLVCGNDGSNCCYYKPRPIRVKACPGNYYVYEFISPTSCNTAYCSDANSVTPALPTEASDAQSNMTTVPTTNNSTFDPCNNYSVLNDDWRSIRSYSNGHDDTLVKWNGWYRLYLQGASAQMSEWCVSYMPCGGYTPLSLGASHPRVQDGIVTREVYGSNGSDCTAYTSKPIQVKACPGDYYVYKLVRPDVSMPMPSYCAVTARHPSYDPCNNYTSLDQPWRANNETGLNICDMAFNWNGWYRLFYYGMNIRMPESCIPTSRCGTYYPLWLNGPHPQIEDGVVSRQVCGNGGRDCYYIKSFTIQVKACPGNYYVYEFVRPVSCNMAYCSDSSTINSTSNLTTAVSNEDFNMTMTTNPDNATVDPCYNYTVLNDIWRTTYNLYSPYYYSYGLSSYISSNDDTLTEWNGWYRLYLQRADAQIAEWCLYSVSSGGYTPLFLNGSHPRLMDGIVTRGVYGSLSGDYNTGRCYYYRSKPIQVKACPGHYYVYKLVKPDISIPMPTYTAVAKSSYSYDPCDNYFSLDQPWRANNKTGLGVCDNNFNWNGWYRLFYHGMNIRMAESCVNISRCGTFYSLWLNGPHPQIEDGVVIRQVCGSAESDCCFYKSTPIKVKACPGGYYVYGLVHPTTCNAAYCTDASTITPALPTETSGAQSNTASPTTDNPAIEPCTNYSVLNNYWRGSVSSYGQDDTLVEWNGWYRLYLQGASAQLPEWCMSYTSCGGYTPLSLGGSHPQPEDGIVTRDVYGSSGSDCTAYTSKPIQVKACPGDYYVYKLVRPDVSMPMPSYCAVPAIRRPSYDPCNNYTSLDQPWRANNETGLNICDGNFNWNGWYRLFYRGMNIRMSVSCVPTYRCGTDSTLWLNGPHPQIEDGVVTRQVYGNRGNDCYYYKLTAIQVKACTGNYYVYELVRPNSCNMAYCTDSSTITPHSNSATQEGFNINTTNNLSNSTFDPCDNYTVLDHTWRIPYSHYGYGYYTGGSSIYYGTHDDSIPEWNGWYRFFLQGKNAQIPEWCVSAMTSGGHTSLLLSGSHPLVKDGIVTRNVYGSYNYIYYSTQCRHYESNPIQVKACPGHYYVYKLVKPSLSIPMPVYTAVVSNSPNYDPCYNYTALDQPWRANNETGLGVCDRKFPWNGWYRMFYYGLNISMPENCVPRSRCGTYYTLWLNGPHPEIEDGVVTRQVCGNDGSDCCYYRSIPIQVKACPDNYHVYKFVQPVDCNLAYCTDASTIDPIPTPITNETEINMTTATSPTDSTFDPCYNYTVLDDIWRATYSFYGYGYYASGSSSDYGSHDDTLTEWNGWYRLHLRGADALIAEWCVDSVSSGGYTALFLGGSHPLLRDGIVTREIYGSYGSDYFRKQCNYYRSKPIQVKACPERYYVYKLVRPSLLMPLPTYTAGKVYFHISW